MYHHNSTSLFSFKGSLEFVSVNLQQLIKYIYDVGGKLTFTRKPHSILPTYLPPWAMEEKERVENRLEIRQSTGK